MFENCDHAAIGRPTSGGGVFATTHWTVLLAARGESPEARAALNALCQTYWFPAYALIRGRGIDPELARDLTQDFFAKILSQNALGKARRERGRFRSFLAQSVKNFLADEWDKSQALKRGGGVKVLSLDLEAAEGRYHEPSSDASPDRDYDRRWAAQIIEEARRRFQAENTDPRRSEILRVLNQLGDPDAPSLAEEASRLGLPLNTLKSHLHRARARYAGIVRDVVAQTVATPADVGTELRHLLAALEE